MDIILVEGIRKTRQNTQLTNLLLIMIMIMNHYVNIQNKDHFAAPHFENR